MSIYVGSEGYEISARGATVLHRPLGMLHAVDKAEPSQSLCGVQPPHGWPSWTWSADWPGARCVLCDNAYLEHVPASPVLQDPLTDVANRSLVLDRLRQGMARADRNRRPVALLLIDLDGFSDVNERAGHAAGDAVLVEVAQRLCRSTSTADTVGRYGGDEFVVVAEDLASATDGHDLADRLLADLVVPVPGHADLVVTASIGVAVAEPGGPPGQLLVDAGAALQRAKDQGGSRVAGPA